MNQSFERVNDHHKKEGRRCFRKLGRFKKSVQPSFPREKIESSKASLLNKAIHHLSYLICVLIIFFLLTKISQIVVPWFVWIVFVTTGFFFWNIKQKSRSQLFLYFYCQLNLRSYWTRGHLNFSARICTNKRNRSSWPRDFNVISSSF